MKRWILLLAMLLGASPCFAKNPSDVWNLDELKKVPEATWGEEREQDGVRTRKVWYRGEPYQNHDTRVFAFVSRPEGEGPFPGIVLVHGGGGTAFSKWAELWAQAGYVAIAMDLAGCEIVEDCSTEGKDSRRKMADGGPGQSDMDKFCEFNDEDYKKMWTYHAIANIMRAHSLLDSLPYVDAERTAATGISWGGYLTTMVAGIDDRFQVVVPVYGCGQLEKNSVWTPTFRKMNWNLLCRWNDYFDPISYVGRAKCRMFFVTGTDDFAYPMDIHFQNFTRVKNADVRLQVQMPHSHGSGWRPKEIRTYVDSVLKGTPAPPCLKNLQAKRNADGTLTVTAEGKYEVPIVSGTLHYSTDLGGYEKGKWTIRTWNSVPAEKDGKRLIATLPAEVAAKSPLRLYLDAVDASGNMASTHYLLVRPKYRPEYTPAPQGAVILLGKDADGTFINRFLDKNGEPCPWHEEDGVITSGTTNGKGEAVRTNHLHSDFLFRDAHIHAEFLLPASGAGNSGLYIHGNYEMQILNTYAAHDVDIHGAGALYGFYAPRDNALLTPDQWQVYDIDYRAVRRDASGKIVTPGRITAYLNGVLVLEDKTFEEPVSMYHPFRYGNTPYLDKKWEHEKKTGFGPLFLQDHECPVKFRNVWVKDLTE
ncbi:MAG: DUF1080 domain-containing protein [Planctomycetia bacterium]|nr:DUF1080 domain-containing protein [Planctomycetia bacterium]